MPQENNGSVQTVCYLLEHSHGVSELVLNRHEVDDLKAYELVSLVPISGQRPELPSMESVGRAIALDDWFAKHPQVLTEGQTADDGTVDPV